MSRKNPFYIAAAVRAVLLAALCLTARGDDDDQPAPAVATVVTVQTGKLQRATLHGYVEGFGVVGPAPAENGQPAASASVACAVAGVVAQVNVSEGQHVEKGDVMFQLDSRVADVAAAFAQKTLDRQQALLRMNNTSQKAVEDAQQQLAAAEAQRALLQVKAPLSGTVLRVNARAGEAVDPAAALAEIADLGRLAVSTEIPSAEAAQARAGQKMILLTDPPVTTAVSFVSPEINASNDTVTVRAPAPSGLRAGQFVRLRIVTAEHADCLAAPAQSVVTDADGNPVVAIVSNDEANQTPVKTGLREGGLVEIEAPGLKEGQAVVTVGAYGLPKETKVRVAGP